MPEPLAPVSSGLFTRDAAPVPLAGVVVDAEISSIGARVVVTQRFVNREPTPIEATYLFPLEEGAAVCGFEALVNGSVIAGEVKERDEAFRIYDEAMERGDGAFLLDEERPDVFQASIGNLPPGREATVRLTYVAEVAAADRGLRFVLPTTVSPRYAPAEDHKGVGRPDSEALNSPRLFEVPYGLELTVKVAMNGTIRLLESPSHPIAVAMDGTRATAKLSTRETALDRDFILSIEADGLDRPQLWMERDGTGQGAVAVAFTPQFADRAAAADITFVVDRSGSMEGSSIAEVRNALQLALRSLTAGCRVNIVGFGSTFSALFPESRAYDDATLAEASAHVARMQADLGGTELLPALEFALSAPAAPGLVRQVVVLTDGEVTNTDAVLAQAKARLGSARIFTFGIGAGASHHLVNGLARAGGGSAEFIFPGERIEPKVVRQLGRLLSPALTNVAVDWGALRASAATAAVPPVFAGHRVIVYGFCDQFVQSRVRLTADGPSGPLSFDVDVDPASATGGRTVATLAARARIRELEESPEWLNQRGSRQSDRKAGAARQEIISLAIRYCLISRETSFVAIERREAPVTGEIQLRRVPIALTSGWGDLSRPRARSAVPGAPRVMADLAASTIDSGDEFAGHAPAPPPMASMRHPSAMASMSRISSGARRLFKRAIHTAARDSRPTPGRAARSAPPSAASAPMLRLVSLQRADGSWDLTAELAAAMGRPLRQLEDVLGASASSDAARRAWATALALAWLRLHAASSEPQWRLLAAKGERYLEAAAVPPPAESPWVDAGRAFLARS